MIDKWIWRKFGVNGHKRRRAGFLFVNDFCNEISSYCRQQGQSLQNVTTEQFPSESQQAASACSCLSPSAAQQYSVQSLILLWGLSIPHPRPVWKDEESCRKWRVFIRQTCHKACRHLPPLIFYYTWQCLLTLNTRLLDVDLVNICLPFQHKPVVQIVGACLIFVFTWARLHSALRAVCPNFALPAHITLL